MAHLFLEETAIGDVAFVAEGETLEELFKVAGHAVANTMVKNWEEIDHKVSKGFNIEAETVEMLLYHFLQEIIYYKDAEMLLFNRFDLEFRGPVEKDGKWELRVQASGEEIDPDRHELTADVKAVALHNFSVEETAKGWRAEVILDV